MCTTCGCAADGASLETGVAPHTHDDETGHTHGPERAAGGRPTHQHGAAAEQIPVHAHDAGATRRVQIEQDILAKNDAYAAQNRQQLAERGIFALNLVSSPGSGKTTLLCRTIAQLQGIRVAVIEGDQQTSRDAERIRATGAPAVQINTGRGCHLDAHMVGHAIAKLDLPEEALLMIENVGNLVCPAAFDLGEAHKVVIFSITEGEDKPIKYPDMFRAASLMLLSKIDLLPYLEFDADAAIAYARRVNPDLRVIQVSAVSGAGMVEWLDFLRDGMQLACRARQDSVAHLKRRVAQLEAQLQQSRF